MQHFVLGILKQLFLGIHSSDCNAFLISSTIIFQIHTELLLRVKFGLTPSKKIGFTCLNEGSLEMMKNAFYFILKSLLVLNVLTFVDV